MTFNEIVSSMLRSDDGSWNARIPETWMQGRAIYGGLSSALCLQAIYNECTDLPPLRSAQINFIAPANDAVTINIQVLRKGKSVSFVNAELIGEKGLATQAIFCFGTSRLSKIDNDFINTPTVPGPEDSTDLFKSEKGPAFTQNFDCLHSAGSLPISSSQAPEFHLWVRHKDHAAKSISALLCIADMAPPAVLSMFAEIAPVSSMTWMLNFLSEDTRTQNGWWLLNSKAEHARHGYSSQDMKIWNSHGELIITGRQSVAFFY